MPPLACATRALCAAYLDALGRGETQDPATFANLLWTEWSDACAAFIAAWQQGAGIEDNTLVMETAAKGAARIQGANAWFCQLIEDLLFDFVRDNLLPAGRRLMQ